jgi:hypothetical protein
MATSPNPAARLLLDGFDVNGNAPETPGETIRTTVRPTPIPHLRA